MDAPTPNFSEYEKTEFDFEIQKEAISDKNNKFSLLFNTVDSKLNIKATNDDIIQKTYSNTFSVDVIKENKYFLQFDDLKEICEELKDRISESKISLIEETNSLILSIPLPSSKIKDAFFELKEIIKSDKDLIKELSSLVKTQKEEISLLTKKVEDLNLFKKEMSFILKYYISNLDSLIVNSSNYNTAIKNWINPNEVIKANLLYRLSRDGPEIVTFHKLCDNKGPVLGLFYLTNGSRIGFFVNDCFDSTSEWKKCLNCFLFNLEKNQKYRLLTNFYNPPLTHYCKIDCGPSMNCLGCNTNVNLKHIYHSVQQNYIDKIFENGSKILPSKQGQETEYEVIETEIFQISYIK